MGNCFRAGGKESYDQTVNEQQPSRAAETMRDIEQVGPSEPEALTNLNLTEFTLSTSKKATHGFGSDRLLGEGRFGKVYKGFIKVGIDMSTVAVKKMRPGSYINKQEWDAEVNFLGKYLHPNLVKLLGYCLDEKKVHLGYEYMQKGSLGNHLFRNNQESLAWGIRLNIAIGAARGLAFLHTTGAIHRDFSASKILLDSIGASDNVPGCITLCHVAPEYIVSGHLTVKSNVYSFGVVLLEILTGRRVPMRPEYERNLLMKKEEVRMIMDPKLEDRYNINGACQVAKLIIICMKTNPKDRPSMDEVLVVLERVNELDAI